MNQLNWFHNGVILGILGLHSVTIHMILLVLSYSLQTQWDILLTPLYRFIFRPPRALFVKMLFSILKQCTKQTSFHWQVLLNRDSSYFFELYNWMDVFLCALFWASLITSLSWRTRSGNTCNNVWQISMHVAQWFYNGGRRTNEVENKHSKNYLLGFLERKGSDSQRRLF